MFGQGAADGGDDASGIEPVIGSALELLDMDVVYVAEFSDGRQVFRAAVGDAASFAIEVGTGPRLEETYCQRMVIGEIPAVIPDAAADQRVAHLESTREMRIGAYVGVPIYRSDGSLFGTLCCLSHEPHPMLRERDASYLAMIGRLLGERLHLQAQRARAISQIRTVVDNEGQLLVALQPIIEVDGGRIAAVEALARFPDLPDPPGFVFSQVWSVGLGHDLELAVIDHALTLLCEFPAHCRLAVNVSPDVITYQGFTARLTRSPAPLERLIVEVTEHAAVTNYEATTTVLAPLRAGGLMLAVDDAGAGFASFAHVLRLRPDIVKIDRSLLAGIGSGEPAPRALFVALVNIATEINASVTAEGVETLEELAELRALGVSHVQGFLLGHPTTDSSTWRSWRDPLNARSHAATQ
ncbi:EAL domain-containing protein [Nocardioides immobilis]|uniref:EAL domain-containing protein n=1 Tax=Nocardioides immobilis TaxID=2049295 RepID=A0A417XS89_9ACTN|nr:EAL domain-containing protein [Nocardioides immobilis]RHW22797.1 EAL domain-containing protein [Nocardioides immobilis]